MPNIDSGRSGRTVDLQEIAGWICTLTELSEKMLTAVKASDWQTFAAVTAERTPYFEALIAAKSVLDGPNAHTDVSQIDDSEAFLMDIHDQFKKVAKVNQEIFDTISNKKQDLVKQMNDVYQGMVFLKRYGSQINQERVISKVI